MDAHRRMAQRRQAFNGDPFDSTGGLIPDTKTNTVKTNAILPPSVVNQSSPTPTLPSSSSSSSSHSSSSSSSSSSSNSSPTSSPTTPPPTPTSISTTSHHTPSLPTTSFTHTGTTSHTSQSTPTDASGNVSSSGTTISTGAVVGGVAAGMLGLAGIIFAILYFIRRLKKRRDDNAFDSDVFRRQSRMLNDEPHLLSDNNNSSPFAPRPPTMIERRMNSTPVSNMGGSSYGPGSAYGENDYNAGYSHSGFAPGQVVPHHQSYGDSYMGSPMSGPMSPQMSVNYGDVGAGQSQSAYLSRQPPADGPAPAVNTPHYVDLSRSSVTPFQAAQYEEIHRRLNMPAPAPVLGSLAEEEYPREEPAPKGPSPFADPSEDVLPPPSPVHSNRSRADSNPPTLPELNPPMSPVYGLRPATAESPNNRTEASTADLPAAPAPAHVSRPNPTGQKRPDTVYTIYDDEDAYGGI